MSRASITVKSANGSKRFAIPDGGEVHSYYDSRSSSYDPSTSSESYSSGDADYRDDVAPSDSASRPRHHSSRPTRRPEYSTHSSRSSSHRTEAYRDERPPRRRHRHDPPPEAAPPPSHSHSHSPYGLARDPHRRAPSVISSSMDYPPYSGYGPREDYAPYEHHDHHEHHDPHWPPTSRYPPGPPTMMSATTSAASQYPMAALTPYDYFAAPGAAYPGPSSSNPFTPPQSSPNPFVPPPVAPPPASAYYPEQYPPHLTQRPGALARRSFVDPHGMPPYPHQPYPMHQGMVPYYGGYYPPHHSPPPQHDRSSPASDKSKKEKEKEKEAPPAAPAPPPPPPPPPPKTEEEIKKEREAEEAAHTARVLGALRLYNDEEKAKVAAVETIKAEEKKESDRIAAIFDKYEKARVAREEAALKKVEAEKVAALAQAARDKELADASNAAREKAEKEAAEREKAAAEETEKKLAEAKTAAEAAEAEKKTMEAELAKLSKIVPDDDAGKPPLKFHDCVDRNFTLPWHLAKTWKGMEALIKQAFVHIERIGPHVANGNYSLLGPNDEIILPQVWEVVVQPGWEIKMDLWPLPDPIEEMVSLGPGGYPPLDIPPIKPTKASRKSNDKLPTRKASNKRASPAPMPPPINLVMGNRDFGGPDDIIEVVVGDEPPPKKKNRKPASKSVPAFTKWMLGGSRPKGHEKSAAARTARA